MLTLPPLPVATTNYLCYITYVREDIQYFYAPPGAIGRIYLASKFVYGYFT